MASSSTAVATAAPDTYFEVQEVKGIRFSSRKIPPKVEYWVQWKDGSVDTWESPENISEDLIRDYEEQWWNAVKKGEVDVLKSMLAGGKEVLPLIVDENRRSALHFTAATGQAECTKLLLAAGALVDAQDKEGYTPLHMAAGYMHTSTMTVLLAAGADPEVKDNSGKTVVALVDNLRARMPLTLPYLQQRLALEEVANCLTERLFEEVRPAQLLAVREAPNGGREFLVQYDDAHDDEWLAEASLAPDLLSDWEAGLEYVDAECVLDMVQYGYERVFLMRWKDGREDSWEAEENVSVDLIEAFRAKRPELFTMFVDQARQGNAKAAGQVPSAPRMTQDASQPMLTSV